jgi:hypothetical protein
MGGEKLGFFVYFSLLVAKTRRNRVSEVATAIANYLIQHKNLFSVQKPGLLKKPGFSLLVFFTDNCQLPSH